ncbi:MAG TPA: hypothetical protein VK509_23220 [Polyangiales bacterium]|nr:hypothetical protein [Polyangiales bacterium]
MNRTTIAWTAGLWLLSTTQLGCEQVKDACDIGCSEQGIAQGNASITGVKSLDGFFAAVIRFDQKAAQLSAGIDAELSALAGDFGIDPAVLQGSFNGDVGAALRAQFDANLAAGVKVHAEPPRCDLDARAELSASAECQVEAGCDVAVDPGTATLQCKGSCQADVNAKVDCGANAELACTFRGPEVACKGECKGTCSAELSVAARCEGTCKGSCSLMLAGGGRCDGRCNGSCSGSTDSGGRCDGTCTGDCELELSAGATCGGTCKGSCATEAKAGAECNGTCSGECTARGPQADCSGAAEVHCEAMGSASVSCAGHCEGELEPPMAMVQCDASASCNAQAKADASVEVECSEPSIDIDYELRAGLAASAAARMELGMRQLEVRLPRILARVRQARLLVDASAQLGAAASGAAEGTVRAFGSGEIGAVAALRVAECAPVQFDAVPGLIAQSTTELKASLDAAARVTTAVGP